MIVTHSSQGIWAAKHAALITMTDRIRIPAGLSPADESFLTETLHSAGFKPKPDQSFTVRLPESKRTVIVYGISKSLQSLRMAVGYAIRQSLGIKELAVSCNFEGFTETEAAKAIAESAVLASYRFDTYKSEKQACTIERVVVADAKSLVKDAISEGEMLGKVTIKARELINTPAETATPEYVASYAAKMAVDAKLICHVLKKKDLERLGMQGVLSVGQGSSRDPCFVVLEHKGYSSSKTIVVVGKGVTFDSGGLSLKPAQSMETMKEDKSGAAAVIGCLEACSRLKLKHHVIGLIPLVENMPSGSSFKPGDIVTTMSGKTIEILNTDAEGRVILADALHYAKRFKPQAVIDLATLTGACIVALGTSVSGIMGTDKELVERLVAAGEKTGERLWQLPLYEEYAELIKSDYADMKNVTSNVPGGSSAGTISAAMLLKNFTDYPWAHIDITGPAWSDSEKGYLSKGATGVGIRLLVQFLMDY